MTLELNHKGYEQYLVSMTPRYNGVHYIFRFENGRWGLNYDTDITGDVLGYLTNEEVLVTLEEIKNLT